MVSRWRYSTRRLAVTGAALLAMFALGAVSAAGASAAKPEFRFPSGVPKLKISGSSVRLETTAGRAVSCNGSQGAGEFFSSKAITSLVLEFKECTTVLSGITLNCGTISTNPLRAELNYLTNPNSASEVGLVLKPVSGAEFAKASCTSFFGNETLTVTGSVVGKVTPTNELTTNFSLVFAQTAGKQKYEGYYVGSTFTKSILQTSGSGLVTFGPEQSGLEGTEAIEVSLAVMIAA
jgi:hypothetical protein